MSNKARERRWFWQSFALPALTLCWILWTPWGTWIMPDPPEDPVPIEEEIDLDGNEPNILIGDGV